MWLTDKSYIVLKIRWCPLADYASINTRWLVHAVVTGPLSFDNVSVANLGVLGRSLTIRCADVIEIMTIVFTKVIKTPVIVGKPVEGDGRLAFFDGLKRFFRNLVGEDTEKGKIRTLLFNHLNKSLVHLVTTKVLHHLIEGKINNLMPAVHFGDGIVKVVMLKTKTPLLLPVIVFQCNVGNFHRVSLPVLNYYLIMRNEASNSSKPFSCPCFTYIR